MPPLSHSPIGASSVYRVITCPASAGLCEKAPPDESSFEADEGTAAHELAEMSLKQRKMPRNFVGKVISVHGQNFVVTQEMSDFVTEYICEILQVASTRTNPGVKDLIKIEERFNLNWIGRKGMFGTNDASLADRVHRKIHIFDLKYGANDHVVAENNYQLMYYALGILGKEGVENFDTVRLVIVQPRIFPKAENTEDEFFGEQEEEKSRGITEWEISVPDLMKWKDEVLIPAYDLALSENPPFKRDRKACKYCNGKGLCPETGKDLAESVGVNLDTSVEEYDRIVFPEPVTLTSEQMGKILTLLPYLEPYFKEVRRCAVARALDGDVIDGFKLVKGRQGNRAWSDEKAVAQAFSNLGDDLWEKKLLSPAKLEKLLGKDKAKLEPFVTRSEAKLSLAPISDKREAVEPPNKNVLDTFFGESE